MRRFSLWGLLILVLVLAACGGDKAKDDGGSGGGDANTPLATSAATDAPTETTSPVIGNPTLPPAATIDVGNPNANTSGNGGQPASPSSPIPTREGRPTLPPTWTPSSGGGGNNAVATTPTVAPVTVIEPTTVERPAICNTFAPDYARTLDQHFVNTDLTIYWFPVEAAGVTYTVDLYDVTGLVLFSTEVSEPQVTFTADYFPSRGTYYWVIQVKQNGSPFNCGPIDNEVFVIE